MHKLGYTPGYTFDDFRDICINAQIVGKHMCMLQDDLPLEENRTNRSYIIIDTYLSSAEPSARWWSE